MDIRCYELLGELEYLMLNRRGDLRFFKHLVFHKDMVKDSLEMIQLKGVRWFYVREGEKIYRIVSLKKNPEGCKEYRRRYRCTTAYKIQLNEDMLTQMLAEQNVIIPELWNRETGDILFSSSNKGESNGILHEIDYPEYTRLSYFI